MVTEMNRKGKTKKTKKTAAKGKRGRRGLDISVIRKIKAGIKKGVKQKIIADKLGVSQPLVSQIKNKKIYAEV